MKFKSKKGRIIIIISSVVILLILIILAATKGKSEKGTKVSTETVQKRTIIETVSANGKIQPELDVKISPYISGEVIELNVKEGDKVKKGDLLAKIDPEIYRANFDRTRASLNAQRANEANSQARLVQTEAQFLNAKTSFDRSKKLFDQQVISQSEYDAAVANYEVAKAEVDAAKQSVKSSQFAVESIIASLDEAEGNLTKTAIRAPSDGTVAKLSVEVGERVTGASQFSAGTEIMKLANLEEMEVVVEVNENDIVRVSLFDTAIIEVDAYLDHKFKGIVTEIATSANTAGTSADQVTNFEVKIRILRESYESLVDTNSIVKSPFRPGMSATVDIQTETTYDVLTLPIQSVVARPDTTGKVETSEKTDETVNQDEFLEVVFLYDNGNAKLQKVKTGIQDNTYIEITEGLNEGDEVITGPYRAVSKNLKNGDAVKKVDKKDLFTEEEK